MGLDPGLVPELVRHLALPLTAGAFPEAEPDALVREAEALEALADELAAIRVEDAEPVLRYLKGSEWDGAAKEAFQEVLNVLAGDGGKAAPLADLEGDALLERVEQAIRQEARLLRDHAVTMEHTQWMQYAALALLALAIARLLVWVYLYGPSVLRLIQVRTLMTRMSIQALKRRLIMNMLAFSAIMGGMDLAVQGAQFLFGNREKLDLRSVLMSLGNGALTGLVFTGVDFGLSRLATRELVFVVSRAELGVRDQLAAFGQSIYGRALVGGVSGTVGSIPGLALSDQLDPAHLFYSFVAGTAGGIAIPQSARVRYTPAPAGELTAGPAPSSHTSSGPAPSAASLPGPPPPGAPPSGHTASWAAGGTLDLAHSAEPALGGRSTGTDLSSTRHPTGPVPFSDGHPVGPDPVPGGRPAVPERGPSGEAAGGRTTSGAEPRRVVEPAQVVLSGEAPRAPGGPERQAHPLPAGGDGSTPATAHQARVIEGEVVRRQDTPPQGAEPSTGTNASRAPTHQPTHGPTHGPAPAHPAPAPAAHPLPVPAGGQADGPMPGPAGHPAPGPMGGQAGHPMPVPAGGQAAVVGLAATPNAAPGHPQPLHDPVPLRTPYVPPTPPPPGPEPDAQDGRPDSPGDAGHRAQHHDPGSPRQEDGRDAPQGSDRPGVLDQARDPVDTAPAAATHAQGAAPERTADGQGGVSAHASDDGHGIAAGRTGDGQDGAAGRAGDRHGAGGSRTGQAQDGPVVPVGAAHEPPAARAAAPRETPPPARPGRPHDTPPTHAAEPHGRPPGHPAEPHDARPAHPGDRHAPPPAHPGDAGRATAPHGSGDAGRATAPHDSGHGRDPAGHAPATRDETTPPSQAAKDSGSGTGRIDQLINRDGTPPPLLDPALVARGRHVARLIHTPVPDDAFAHTLGTMTDIVTHDIQNPANAQKQDRLYALSKSMGVPGGYEQLVRVFDEAQRQGFDPAGATDKGELLDRLEQHRQSDPMLLPGLWIAHNQIAWPTFPIARSLARMDQVLSGNTGSRPHVSVARLRTLTNAADLGFYSIEHVGRLFLDADARGYDVQGARDRFGLVHELRQARRDDHELWNGLRIVDEHSIGGLDDAAARALSRTEGALRWVSPDGRLLDLAAETGFSHAMRTFSEMLTAADALGALPEYPATRAELVDSLAGFRERDTNGWDVRVMEERFPGTRMDEARASTLGRLDRVTTGGGAHTALDPLLALSRELGLGDSPARLAHVAGRAQRLGFDPMGAGDRPALVEALRGYMDTAPDTWAKVRVSERYSTPLSEPVTSALARVDRILGPQREARAWVLDPLRRLAGDLGLEHSVERLAHVFTAAQERGFDPAGAADRADLVQRLKAYYRAPTEEPYRFSRTLMRQAEEALSDQLRQSSARDAGAARASIGQGDPLTSGLQRERLRALEARARAWESWPSEPEVSYRSDPEAFDRDLAEAFARADRGEPVIPYMTEDATAGLAAPGTGMRFGREIEYDFPRALDRHRDAINSAIARDLYDAGLTQDPWLHDYHASHDVGYPEGDNGWRLEKDNTVAGELVSPPLYDTPRTWQSLALATEIIKSHGGVITEDTGGHLHVDTSAFDHIPAFYQRTLRLVLKDYYDTFIRLWTNPEQPDHRRMEFCVPNQVHTGGYASIDAMRKQHEKHTLAINFESVQGGRSDHTEFRLPDGSLDPGVIQAQTKLVLGTVGLAQRLADDHFPLNHGDKDLHGVHSADRMRMDYSSYFELADLLFHRAVDKAQLTALFAVTRWSKRGLYEGFL
ncbi:MULTISPECIES: hypothetical protein [unclassified Nonomuraea]|uniref:hypothetical protein n=1 Tax=unclassified Nonomuraea TaxID=2593643 RepID=UPI00340DD32E